MSFVHDKMDKSQNSIARMVKKENNFSNVMNLLISLIGMLTRGHKSGGFFHFSLSFLEMGSNFIMTSLAKCLRSLEEPMVDKYRYFLYKSVISKHQFHGAMLQLE